MTVSDNKLESIPKEMGQLTNIRFLWLTNNLLESVPMELGQLEMLENLYLGGNDLVFLPGEVCSLETSPIGNTEIDIVPYVLCLGIVN